MADLRRSRPAADALGRRRPLTAPAAAGALVRTLNERIGSDLRDLWTDEDTVECTIDGARAVEVLTTLRDDPDLAFFMLADAAARIGQLAGDDAWILIGGIDVVATQLMGALDKRYADRASGVTIDVHPNSARLAAIAREHASRLRSALDLRKVEEVVAANASGGTGALGLHQIDKALELGQVHELFVTSAFVEGHADAALAASIFHYDEYSIPVTKQYLAERGVAVRLTPR